MPLSSRRAHAREHVAAPRPSGDDTLAVLTAETSEQARTLYSHAEWISVVMVALSLLGYLGCGAAVAEDHSWSSVRVALVVAVLITVQLFAVLLATTWAKTYSLDVQRRASLRSA